MRRWWLQLAPRERRVVLLGLLGLGLLLPYWLLWLPLVEQRERLDETLVQQRQDLAWMQAAAQQLRALPGDAGLAEVADDASLLGRVDAAVREAGLGAAVRRVQPEGDTRVQLWLEGIGFDAMLRWLAQLQAGHGVRVDSLAVDRREQPGLVDGRVILVRGSE